MGFGCGFAVCCTYCPWRWMADGGSSAFALRCLVVGKSNIVALGSSCVCAGLGVGSDCGAGG